MSKAINIRTMMAAAVAALLLPLALVPTGCQKDDYADERAVTLQFSSDTISFDTVFTTMGSATLQLKVYNRSSKDIELSSVTLEKGRGSRFRLNVDGDTSLVARHVELQAGDSIFIFIQANINPLDETEPFLVEDRIVFGNGQRLPLTAWGRNAYYHPMPDSGWFAPIDCANWRHDRPHVILGNAAVLDGNTLTINAGEEIYFAGNGMLIVDSNAHLIVNGTEESPVVFSSLRHDGWYDFLPGQWQTIWFYNYSTGNTIDHAIIENGTGAIRCYPNSELSISNTVIRSMSDAAVIGQNAKITGRNMLVYNCLSSVVLIGGGEYSFANGTFAHYWPYGTRDTTGVIVSNYYPVEGGYVANDMRAANFTDCIIYGTYRPSEVSIGDAEGFAMNYRFDHCIVKGGEWDEDPMFTDPSDDDYTLQEESPALGI